jgi:RNA polymerase sigma factor (sigma-70 family)
MVYNVCLNYLHNTQDAEEATQDVFVRIHGSLNSYCQKATLKTWIYRIAVNHCFDRVKANKAQKRFAQIQSLFGIGKNEITPVDFNHPGVKLEDQEAVSEIMKAIHALPENQKTALILKSIEGLSQKEIAAVMEIGEKAAESLLSRAKVNLKRMLNDKEGNVF